MKDRPTAGNEVEEARAASQATGRIGVEVLFRKHASFVAAFLGRLGVPSADVDDLVQEVFLVVHRKGGFEPGPAKPRSWLGAIAVRVASTRRRGLARRREESCDEVLAAVDAEGARPDQQLGTQQALARVQRALDSLDQEHRAVFVLYELEGEPCTAIAAAFELPIGTVYSRLHNARKRFMQAHGELLQADGDSSPAGLLREERV